MTDGLNTKLKVYYSSKGLNNKNITGHLNSKQAKVCYSDASYSVPTALQTGLVVGLVS